MQKWDRKRKKMLPFKLLEHKITTLREVMCLIVDGITPEKWNYHLNFFQYIKHFSFFDNEH